MKYLRVQGNCLSTLFIRECSTEVLFCVTQVWVEQCWEYKGADGSMQGLFSLWQLGQWLTSEHLYDSLEVLHLLFCLKLIHLLASRTTLSAVVVNFRYRRIMQDDSMCWQSGFI